MGKTNEKGKLSYTFAKAGDYTLIAVKTNYLPEYAGIVIREKPQPVLALVLTAPMSSKPGEPVIMSVTQKNTTDKISDAQIYAMTKEQSDALQAKIAEANAAKIPIDWEAAMISIKASLLGKTNGSGELKYTFASEGLYLLIAIKTGFTPGRAAIAVKNPVLALSIQAPRMAKIGETVVINVSQRGTGNAVKDASVWAVGKDKAAEFQAAWAKASVNGQETDWESLVGSYGTKLGITGSDGKMQAAFSKDGNYSLVAVKKGYIPALSGILIAPPSTTTTTKPTDKKL
jgi:hypothetical protein